MTGDMHLKTFGYEESGEGRAARTSSMLLRSSWLSGSSLLLLSTKRIMLTFHLVSEMHNPQPDCALIHGADSGEDEDSDDKSEGLLEPIALRGDCRADCSSDTARVGKSLRCFGIGRAPSQFLGAYENLGLSSIEARIESSSAACLLVHFPSVAKHDA
jgi:hypothetical protein